VIISLSDLPFADAFLLAAIFDLGSEKFSKVVGLFYGFDGESGRGAIAREDDDVACVDEPKEEGLAELGIADAVEFNFFCVFIEYTCDVAKAFCGENVVVAANFYYFPKGIK
jgi:hypothetical protein